MTLPVAGWYDDPADAEQLRWWTGTMWSDARERRVPAPPIAPEAAAEPDSVPEVSPFAADPSAPLPYGPAAVTGATGALPTDSSPAGPPELPPFARPAAVTEIPAAPAAPVRSVGAQLRRANPLAFTGLLVGFLALVFNPLGGPGLLTLVLGIMGLRRANELKRRGAAGTGLAWAIAALVLGGIAAVRVAAKLIGMAG
jgi:hypothetical protein